MCVTRCNRIADCAARNIYTTTINDKHAVFLVVRREIDQNSDCLGRQLRLVSKLKYGTRELCCTVFRTFRFLVQLDSRGIESCI